MTLSETNSRPVAPNGHEQPALELVAVSKSYDGVPALRSVDMKVRSRQIHALVGGNGSGKSTLAKIVAGVVRADATVGSVRVGSVTAHAHQWNSELSRLAGVRVVHQDPAVFANATVAENLAVGPGFVLGPGRRIKWGEQRKRAQQILDRFSVNAGPDTPVWKLRSAERMKLAIARALQDDHNYSSGLLILDEPTAALPAPEIARFLQWIRDYAAGNRSIIFVSHHLDEVMGLADEVTVLRDGAKVATVGIHELDHDRLVELITGRVSRSSPAVPNTSAAKVGELVLQVDDLRGGAVRGVDLNLRKGQILGIAGLLGSGRTTLLELLYGAAQASGGTIQIGNQPLPMRTPRDGIRAGIMYVPESRALTAFYGMSLCANLSASVVKEYAVRGIFRHAQERRDARVLIEQYGIKAQSLNQGFEHLSGGNQQKAIMARAIRCRPAILLLDEPTQGVDVGARDDIHDIVRASVASGTSVIVVSSDLEELLELSDRILVMRGGRIAAEVAGDIDIDSLLGLVFEGDTEVSI